MCWGGGDKDTETKGKGNRENKGKQRGNGSRAPAPARRPGGQTRGKEERASNTGENTGTHHHHITTENWELGTGGTYRSIGKSIRGSRRGSKKKMKTKIKIINNEKE